MPRDQFIDVGIDSAGNIVTTTQVTVYNARTTTLVAATDGPFTAEAGAGLKGNPFPASTGYISFWMEPGEYDVLIQDTSSPKKFADRTVRFNARPYGSFYSVDSPPVFNDTKTFSMDGTLASGDKAPGFIVDLAASNQAVKLIRARHYCEVGTVTWSVLRNGVAISGWTDIQSTTTKASFDGSDISLGSGDLLEVQVTATSGSGGGLGVSLVLEHRLGT